MKKQPQTILGSTTKSIGDLLWLYKPYFKYGKLFVVLSLLFWCIIVPFAQMIGVYLPSAIVNMLDSGVSFSKIFISVIIMQCILMFQPMYEDVFNLFCKNKTYSNIDAKLKKIVFEKSVKTDMKYIDDPVYYDKFSWAISQYANKAQEVHGMINKIASTIITIISMLSIIAILSPLAVVVTILGTVLENIMYVYTNRYDVAQEEELVPINRRLGYCHRVFYENKYAMDLKSTSVRLNLIRDFDEAQEKKISILKKYAKKMIPWSLAGNLTFYIARTFVILNIAYGIYTGRIETVGTYLTMMVSVETLKNAMNEMFYYVKDANRLSMYAKKIRAFFDTESIIETEQNTAKIFPNGRFDIKMKNVNFNYENSNFLLKNINLEISQGEKVAIVGENGVGKSTLVKLLMRFYDVSGGEILINNVNIKEYNLESLRKHIGVAFQHTNIYAMSMYDNLNVYDNGEIDTSMLKSAGVEKILKKNNADINSELTKEFDKSGIMLSGGEIQKIGIARLLSGDFGLLIFDEPSSALDPLAEHEMSELILSSSNYATTIIIAHRLSTIRNVDKIILISNGTVSEVGTHDELMVAKGKYFEMFSKQAENYIN